MSASQQPILVTGSHRSGTTWIGQVLAADSSVAYIHEPFTLTTRPGVFPYRIPYWYFRVPSPPPPEFVAAYERLLGYHYAFSAELRAIESLRDVARLGRDVARFSMFRAQKRRPLVKDPLALLSAEWVARAFQSAVIISVRHPLAFVSSLLRLGWRFDFAHLQNQKAAMELLVESEEDIALGRKLGPDDPLVEAAYLWKVLHRVIARYRVDHPEWTFVRYEDLAADPRNAFGPVFAKLGLKFDQKVHRRIEHLSGSENPAERANDARVTRVASSVYSVQSLRRLSVADSARVHEVVASVSALFYSEEEW